MTEPANFQAAIDALAKACVGLADVSVTLDGISPAHYRWANGFQEEVPDRRDVSLRIIDTTDASLHPASREELYEQAMCYFADRLAEMRSSTAPVDQPTPRDCVVRVARKIRERCFDLTNLEAVIGEVAEALGDLGDAVDAMEGQ